MSKKTTIVLSAILFVVLVGLIYCERRWPTEGSELISGLLSRG